MNDRIWRIAECISEGWTIAHICENFHINSAGELAIIVRILKSNGVILQKSRRWHP